MLGLESAISGFSHLSVILGWELLSKTNRTQGPKQANRTQDSQSFWKLPPKEDFSRDEACYLSKVSQQPSSERRNGRLHKPPEHQDRDPFGQLEIQIRHSMQTSKSKLKEGQEGKFLLSEALSTLEWGIICTWTQLWPSFQVRMSLAGQGKSKQCSCSRHGHGAATGTAGWSCADPMCDMQEKLFKHSKPSLHSP